MAHDLVSNVNHSTSSKLFGKSILVQTHLNIISLSEVSVQTPHIIPVISALSCIICIHPDETGEVLFVQMNFKQPQHIIIQCRFPAVFSWHPAVFCGPPFHSLLQLHLTTTWAHPFLWGIYSSRDCCSKTWGFLPASSQPPACSLQFPARRVYWQGLLFTIVFYWNVSSLESRRKYYLVSFRIVKHVFTSHKGGLMAHSFALCSTCSNTASQQWPQDFKE